MKDIINGLIERFRRQHVQARRYVAMMLVLALLTTLFVNWQLHGVGISMTADYHCGYEEHQHTAACYEKVLTCGYEEGEPETPVTSSDSSADPVSAYSAEEPEEPEEPVQTEPETIWVPHEHTDACYEEHRVLTCYQEEHEHTDNCFDEYGALICGEFEHIHDDSCYTTEYELVCGLDEGELVEEPNPAYQEMPASRPVVDLPTEPAETTPDEPVLHHHTDACYTEELVCTIPEHHHTVECLADTQADVETAEEWQAAANVALNGNWAEDLLTVAKSQLDYQQSDKNFKLDVEDQQVLRGYSRYGAWYGNPYGAWDVMFLSYCLHFAGVPQTVVPQRAGVMALHSDLRGSQWLTDADGSTARPGDIVIYNTLTTEQVAVDESSYGIALLDLDEDPDTAAQLTASEPQVDTRTVTTETVGVVSAVDPDAGTLTVISGNVDGKVAEVPAAMSDVTSVISVTGAYAAETTAAAPEDPAGAQEELDGSYALLEDEDGFGATVDWVGDADPYGIALLAAGDDHDLNTWITDVNYEKTTDGKTWTSIGAGSVTVDSGTRVRVNLKYTVKPGVLTPDHNTLTYQLPKGLPMPDVVTGNIVDESDKDEAGNAKVVGSFTVDTDGKVTLTFTDEKFIGTDDKGGLPFTGTFKAAVTASADNFEDEKEIKFKDDCILTIKKKTADIKISDKNVDWATAEYDKTTRKLTIKISNYNQSEQEEHRIRIQYKVSVSDDPSWKNPSVGKLIYTNTATWGELTETTTTTITRDVEQVKKTGWQDPGNDRKLHYQVVINPAGEDLSAGQTRAEKIELWDNISTTNGAIATGDVNSVKLYFYNYDETVGVTTGKEVPRNMYRILEADKNGWLHMEIPNMAALILVYDCNVKDGSAAASYQVSNTVTLSNGSKSSDSGITYQVKADATATTAQFVLRKKDSYSGVSLKGAEFTIYQYDKAIEGWTKWAGNGTGTLTTDENGQASLAVLNSETASCLKPDVLYKLVETKAPTDYQLDATPHYLLFRKNASAENEQKAFANATGVAEGTTILTVNDETVDLNSNVQVGSDAGTTTAEYSNVYSKLTVSKLWLDADTRQPVEPAVNSIHIKVWRYTDNDKDRTPFAEADLTADNNWTWSESGDKLPLTDKNGNAYHYLVKEETTGNWNVYIDNNGVQTGNITVQNYVYTGYELPSTGGMGTAPFGVLGGALAAAAALLLVRKRKQNEEE